MVLKKSYSKTDLKNLSFYAGYRYPKISSSKSASSSFGIWTAYRYQRLSTGTDLLEYWYWFGCVPVYNIEICWLCLLSTWTQPRISVHNMHICFITSNPILIDSKGYKHILRVSQSRELTQNPSESNSRG